VSIAPLKKKVALLSSELPAKTSMVLGEAPSTFLPSASARPRPVSRLVPWSTPTL